MEQELRFGLDLGRLELLKKKNPIWANCEQILRPVFSSFCGQKKVNKKHCSVSTKKLKLHEIKGYFFLNNQNLKKKILG